jgi:WD40 repeat protein
MIIIKHILIICCSFWVSSLCAQPELIIQTGHVGKVNEIKFSRDNKFIASAGDDGKIIIWDMKTAKQFAILEGHNKAVTSIFFLPNEKILISGSLDSSVIFWDYLNQKIVHKIKKLSAEVTSVSSNGAGTQLFIAATALYIYNYNTKKIIDAKTEFNYKKIIPEKTGNAYLFSASNNPDLDEFIGFRKNNGEPESGDYVLEKNLFCADNNGRDFYSYDKKNELTKFIYSNGVYQKKYCVIENIAKYKVEALSSSAKHIAMANREKIIYIYDRNKFSKKFVLGGHNKAPISLTFSEDGNWLASSDETGAIFLWSMENGKLVNIFSSSMTQIADAVMDKEQESLFILYKNGDVKKWIFKSNTILHSKLNTASIIKNVNQTFYCNTILAANDSLLTFNSARITNRINESIQQVEIFNGSATFGSTKTKLSNKSLKKYGNGIKYKDEWTSDSEFASFKKKPNKKGLIKKLTNTKYNFTIDINENGLLLLTNKISPQQKVTFGVFNDRDFYFSNDSSYYWASKQALLNVGFKYGSNLYDFNQFDAIYNRPDIILSQLPFSDSSLIVGSKEAYKKRLKTLGKQSSFDPEKTPELILTSQNETVVKEKNYELKIVANTKIGSLNKLIILLNGVPFPSINGIKLTGSKWDSTVTITLENGKNNIQCFVTTNDENYSLRENFNVFYDAIEITKPNLYILTIGSSKFIQTDFNLNYPAKDIKDISTLLLSSKVYKKVFSLEIKDEALLKSKLADMSAFLSAANESDQIIVFYAGHGVLDKDLNYYLSTYDIDFNSPQKNGIAYDSLETMLGKLKCRKKVVLMDACHSGEIDKEDLVVSDSKKTNEDGGIKFRAVGNSVTNKNIYGSKSSMEISKMLFADTRLNNGVNVISSAGGAEYAIEGGKWNNGVFTYCLINALKNKEADLNKDGEIWVNELQEYLGKKVSEVTGGKQTPTSRAENLISNFRIW